MTRYSVLLVLLLTPACGSSAPDRRDSDRPTDGGVTTVCGDGRCEGAEDCAGCAADCGSCCGNGIVDPGEACDTAIASGNDACPTDAGCADDDPCTADSVAGRACLARCEHTPIDAFVDGDACCPPGAMASDDVDCAPICGDGLCNGTETCATCPDCGDCCGNGILDPGESCEESGAPVACPTECPATDACRPAVVTGSRCWVECSVTPITEPVPGDGCCPPGADRGTDPDCPASCGDGVCAGAETCATCAGDCGPCCGNGELDPGETCDPGMTGPSACPTTCDDGDACTTDVLTGTACQAECVTTPITDPAHGDGCCPARASRATDLDCPVVCGDGVCDANEHCGTCAADCGCASSMVCEVDACVLPPLGLSQTTLFSGAGVYRHFRLSDDGGHVAFLTGRSTQGITATLHLVPTGGGVSVPLATPVDYYDFSPAGGDWLAYVVQQTVGADKVEVLWLAPTGAGPTMELGRNLRFWPQYAFSPDGRYLAFIDEYDPWTDSGRLRLRDLTTGSTQTLATGAHDLLMSPIGEGFVYSTGYNSTLGTVTLARHRFGGTGGPLATGAPATGTRIGCIRFADDGRLVYVDSVTGDAGRLRSVPDLQSTPTTLAPTVAARSGQCFVISQGGTRVAYWESLDDSTHVGTLRVVSSAGGASTLMGTAAGWLRTGHWFDQHLTFLDDYVLSGSGFGTLKYHSAGTAAPVTVATNAYGRYSEARDGRHVAFAAEYDLAAERGRLTLLDLQTGQSRVLATGAKEWAEWAPDQSRVMYVADHDQATDSGRLEVALTTGGPPTVLAPVAYNYRHGFSSDGSRVFYMVNMAGARNDIGDVVLANSDGTGAVTVIPNARVLSSHGFSSNHAHFTVRASAGGLSTQQGTLWVVRTADAAVVEAGGGVGKSEWIGPARLVYATSSSVVVAEVQ